VKPHRVQLRRSKGWKMPADTRKVDRTTRWGNPFRDADRRLAVERFEAWLAQQPALIEQAKAELAGRNLACWCPLGGPCHADAWLRLINDV